MGVRVLLTTVLVAWAVVSGPAPLAAQSADEAWMARLRANEFRHVIQKGDTLERLAERRYGNRHMAGAVQRFNKIENPRKLRAGSEVVLPEVETMVAPGSDAGKRAMLDAKAHFDRVFKTLWAMRASERSVLSAESMPQDIRKDLLAAAKVIEDMPKRSGQMKTALRLLKAMAAGRFDEYGYDLDDVNRRFAYEIRDLQ
jgi:hypothetical protein